VCVCVCVRACACVCGAYLSRSSLKMVPVFTLWCLLSRLSLFRSLTISSVSSLPPCFAPYEAKKTTTTTKPQMSHCVRWRGGERGDVPGCAGRRRGVPRGRWRRTTTRCCTAASPRGGRATPYRGTQCCSSSTRSCTWSWRRELALGCPPTHDTRHTRHTTHDTHDTRHTRRGFMHVLLDTLGLVDGRQLGPELAGDLLHQVGRKPALDFGLDMESRDVSGHSEPRAQRPGTSLSLSLSREEEETRAEVRCASTRTESSSSARNSTSTSGRRQCSQ
jgi:hypothetical protein